MVDDRCQNRLGVIGQHMLAPVHQEQLMLIHLTDLILYGFPGFMSPFWDWPD